MKPIVVVLGSLNMDFVVSVDQLPAPGQTVLGANFKMLPGGKGANQACACGRLGRDSVTTRMAGRTGFDVFADHLKSSLTAAGVDVSAVQPTKAEPTGVAQIWVDREGQNSIVVASGANQSFCPDDVIALRPALRGASYALFQLETPLDTVHAAMNMARQEGVVTILDPAPAQKLTKGFLSLVNILTPNETEACVLLGRPPARVEPADAPEIARALRESCGVDTVVLKLGERGCFWLDADHELHADAFRVQAIDTTAAGDTFNAGLAVALAEGRAIEDALRSANAAAAISVTQIGAQASIPPRADVDLFLSRA
jgi:ribokinase